MIKRCYDSATYQKIGHPDLTNVMYMKVGGVKRWGKVVLVSYIGHKGKIQLGIEPFKKKKQL